MLTSYQLHVLSNLGTVSDVLRSISVPANTESTLVYVLSKYIIFPNIVP